MKADRYNAKECQRLLDKGYKLSTNKKGDLWTLRKNEGGKNLKHRYKDVPDKLPELNPKPKGLAEKVKAAVKGE